MQKFDPPMNSTEPLFQEDKNRFVIFPIKHHDIWDWYKNMEACFWTSGEIDLHQDLHDWNKKLSRDEQYFIKHILAYCAASVKDNLSNNFMNEVQNSEARFFFGFQHMMENIHSETYSLLTDTYVNDEKERSKLLGVIETFPIIKKREQWELKCFTFAERMIAMAAVQSLFFSGAFCSIFWLQKRGLMPGLTFSNELISRDKKLHSDFAVHLHNNHLINKVPETRIREIVIEAIHIQREFICASLPVSLIGMNTNLMTQYLEFAADKFLTELGCEKEYNSTNPFDFMDMSTLQARTKFFEKRVGEFRKTGVINKEKDNNKINYDANF